LEYIIISPFFQAEHLSKKICTGDTCADRKEKLLSPFQARGVKNDIAIYF